MVDREMLSAISGLLDEKLEGLKTDVKGLKADVKVLKTDVKVLKTDVEGLKADVKVLKTDVKVLKTDVEVLKADVKVLKADVKVLKTDVSVLKNDMQNVKIVQLENGVLPRLNTIESCYLDTFQRYKERTEQFDQMAEDIKVLKTVVLNHSGRLSKIPI